MPPSPPPPPPIIAPHDATVTCVKTLAGLKGSSAVFGAEIAGASSPLHDLALALSAYLWMLCGARFVGMHVQPMAGAHTSLTASQLR